MGVYGYSLTPIIPTAMLCIIPVALVRWAAVLGGLGVSLLFVKNNLWETVTLESQNLKYALVGGVFLAQVTIFLVYRIHFFVGAMAAAKTPAEVVVTTAAAILATTTTGEPLPPTL